MPWKEVSTMSQRLEFVALAQQEGANVRALCERFGISSKTAYKWLARYAAAGEAGLVDLSRRPQRMPRRTPQAMEGLVLTTRQAHPAWGGRKLKAYLERAGQTGVPAASTITAILQRHGLLAPAESAKHRAWQRFEQAAPNQLWQMDFKGHFALTAGGRCHPLTVLDDHSRCLLGLTACANETSATVQAALTALIRQYGLPDRILCDNGAPWGTAGDAAHPYTPLHVWLLRLGVALRHGRPNHPQTQGKDERLHRTLQAELLVQGPWADLVASQLAFSQWRELYNYERPHEALAGRVPAECYWPSPRPFPDVLPPVRYPPQLWLRKVQGKGEIYYAGREFQVGRAFTGYTVGLRQVDEQIFDVYFGPTVIWRFDRCGTLRIPGAPRHQSSVGG